VIGILASSGEFSADRLGVAMAVSIGVFGPASLLIGLLFKVRIDRDSLGGQDPYGMPISLSWESITGVSLFRVPGLPFYRVRRAVDKRELWLPGFLRDEPGFAEAVQNLAGAGHPLSGFLRERVRRSDR
jgi:hypothetical protein